MGEDSGKDIEWNESLEELMASEGEKCRGLAWLHTQAELKYSRYNTYIALPVIVLSTLTGFFSASTGSILPEGNITAGALGGVSVLVGVLNTVGSFFAWAKRSEGHKVAYLTYGKLYRFISIEMSLPRDQRMRAKDFLKTVRDQIDRLGEICPAIPPDIIKEFNKRFHDDPDITKPEITNGLEKIEIFKPDVVEVKKEESVKIAVLPERSAVPRKPVTPSLTKVTL
jgi:hypothetical protein